MDQFVGKMGSMLVGQKANQEMAGVEKEINAVANKVEEGTSWLVNKIKGKVQKTLPEVLKEYDMAIGIFPQDAKFEFDEQTRYISVTLPTPCEVSYKDSSVVRFATKVSGYIEKGKLTNVEGMKTKVVMVMVKVTGITCEGAKIHIAAGMKNTRSRDAYEDVREGYKVAKF